MASHSKVCRIFLVASILLSVFSAAALADITGNFGTHISFRPQTTGSEISLVDFDIENELNITYLVSGLSTTFHTHFGIAGVEDVIVTVNATLGILDVRAKVVFGRFPFFGFPFPIYDTLQFFGKEVKTIMTLGGLIVTNIATVQDIGTLGIFGLAPPSAVFGDIIRIKGQTVSGISITAETGLCAEPIEIDIKKHLKVFELEANPFCSTLATGLPKPDILFDYEDILIEGIPLAPGVTANTEIYCDWFLALFGDGGCEALANFVIAGGPVPIHVDLDLIRISGIFLSATLVIFDEATIKLTSGPATLIFTIDGFSGELSEIELLFTGTLNPESNPAKVDLDVVVVPGIGVVDVDIALQIKRAGITFTATADFDPGGGGTAEFDVLSFELEAGKGQLVELATKADFSASGLNEANLAITINF